MFVKIPHDMQLCRRPNYRWEDIKWNFRKLQGVNINFSKLKVA